MVFGSWEIFIFNGPNESSLDRESNCLLLWPCKDESLLLILMWALLLRTIYTKSGVAHEAEWLMAELQVRLIDDCAVCRHPVRFHHKNLLDQPICIVNNHYPLYCKCQGFKGVVKFHLIPMYVWIKLNIVENKWPNWSTPHLAIHAGGAVTQVVFIHGWQDRTNGSVDVWNVPVSELSSYLDHQDGDLDGR